MDKRFLAALTPLFIAACATAPQAPVAPPPPPAAPATAPGPDFLARNAAQKGVVTTPSGVQYFIVKSGDPAGRMPAEGDTVTFHYEGKLTTGSTFDSSLGGEPLSGAVGRFVPGFNEVLKLMRPGDEWVVWIPAELGYKDRALPGIPPNSILRFDLKLLSVTPKA